jgi:hypothetical protein
MCHYKIQNLSHNLVIVAYGQLIELSTFIPSLMHTQPGEDYNLSHFLV